jgi:hypothetical protein
MPALVALTRSGIGRLRARLLHSQLPETAEAGQLSAIGHDALVGSYGDDVPPINMSSLLTSGAQTRSIGLDDEGGYYTSSTLYLQTNSTLGGINGPPDNRQEKRFNSYPATAETNFHL